jgi:hypothetical protein
MVCSLKASRRFVELWEIYHKTFTAVIIPYFNRNVRHLVNLHLVLYVRACLWNGVSLASVFVTFSHFYPSLIFAGKAKSLPSIVGPHNGLNYGKLHLKLKTTYAETFKDSTLRVSS